MNYRFDIQYDGTRYGGWQRQKTTENTIQGKIGYRYREQEGRMRESTLWARWPTAISRQILTVKKYANI